jgi:hypothetical protein
LLLRTCLRGITPIAAGKTPGGLPCFPRQLLLARFLPSPALPVFADIFPYSFPAALVFPIALVFR